MVRDLRKRFYLSLGLLFGVIAISTIGFYFHDQTDRNWIDALWKTLNIVSTVGSVGILGPGERVFGMLVIVFGLGAVMYGFGNLTAILTSGEILSLYEGKKMQNRLDQLNGHVIVCGFGNTGHLIAEQLTAARVPFVVVDRELEVVEDAEQLDYPVIRDDCTKEDTLERAGVSRARGLVTTLEGDADNVFVVLTARGMAPDIHIVARANVPSTIRKLERAGADHVTVPSQIAAYQLANASLRPEMGSFLSQAMGGEKIELVEINIRDHPWMDGKSIRDLNLTRRADVIVFALVPESAEQEFNPPPDRVVDSGDTLLVVARSGARSRLSDLD